MVSKKDKTIRQVFQLSDSNQLQLPFFDASDFFSSSNEESIKKIDLIHHLTKNLDSTFLLQMHGTIDGKNTTRKGDLLIMDRSAMPQENALVLIADNGELVVKQIIKKKNTYYLKSLVNNTPLLAVKEEMNVEIIGVITSVIQQY